MTKLFFLITIFMSFSILLNAQQDTIKKKDPLFLDASKRSSINARIIKKKLEIVKEDDEIFEEEDVLIEQPKEKIDYTYLLPEKEEKLALSHKPKKYLKQESEETPNFMIKPKEVDEDVLVVELFDGKNVTDKKLVTGQDLGTVTSNTKFIKIEYKDFGLVDGDRVKIFLNENEIESNVKLNGLYYTLHIELTEKGYNRIDIKAINQGYVGPNTAEFIIYDDKGRIIANKSWNLKTGDVATLGIVKH